MELVAAAKGYYYYNSVTRQPRHSLSLDGSSFMSEVLDAGKYFVCLNMFSTIPVAFSDTGMLRDTAGVMIDEQPAIFLNIIGH